MQRIISDAALKSAFSPLESYASAALAVSGGPDSMALMHLASRWVVLVGRRAESIAVLTVDHGLRPESASEAAFVAAEAKRLGFAHATLTWAGEKPKTGVQAAARRARYALMTAYCGAHNIACLATAHTADDQAETFLMRLRRGSGLDGLAAMATVSMRSGTPIVRPLLGFSKSRILAYLRAREATFVCDPSNSNLAFERVRLRSAMKALAAAGIARKALALSAARLGRSREALAWAAEGFLEQGFTVTPLGQGEIARDAFRALPAEIALRVLAQTLALIGGKEEPPRMAKLERLMEELARGRFEVTLGGCLIVAARDALQVYREPGRLARTPLPCLPGDTCLWDGRFMLTFSPRLAGGVFVAPLGESGFAAWRKQLKESRVCQGVNRLAALTAPALWRGGKLLAAPALNYVNPAIAGPAGPPATLQLAPRLSRFLKRN